MKRLLKGELEGVLDVDRKLRVREGLGVRRLESLLLNREEKGMFADRENLLCCWVLTCERVGRARTNDNISSANRPRQE